MKMGLYDKFILAKADGSELDPTADYLVLRLDGEAHLYDRRAASFYADAIWDENPVFAAELKNRVKAHEIRLAREAEEECNIND